MLCSLGRERGYPSARGWEKNAEGREGTVQMTSGSGPNCGVGSPDARLLYGGGADEKVGAVAAGTGGLFASGGGAVRVWEKVLTRKGWDGL